MAFQLHIFRITLLLLTLTSAALAQPYQLPFLGDDLTLGERLFTSDHGGGIQTEGKDVIMMAWDWENDEWYSKTGNNNADHVIYEQPVYAMEAGTIVGCWRNVEENPNPPAHHANMVTGQKLIDGDWVDTGLIPGGGNLLFVDQVDGTRALYAHFKPGTIPPGLCPNNDVFFPFEMTIGEGDAYVMLAPADQVPIQKGQFLGEVGNSGSSSEPHLHVHVQDGGSPYPMVFEDGLSKRYVGATTDIQGGWTSFAGQEIPNVDVLVRPPRETTYRMADYESFDNDGTPVYVGIFKPGTHPPAAYFSGDWTSFLNQWSALEGQGYRMQDFEAYEEDGSLVYAGIFEPGTYAPLALFRSDWADFVAGWQAIEARGYRMQDFEAYPNGRGVTYAGIFEPGTYGPVALFRSKWSDFVDGWAAIEATGYRMKDFEAYHDGTELVYAGIFEPGNYAPMALFQSDWDDFLAGWQAIEGEGYRMMDVEVYEENGSLVYAGIFEPDNYVPAATFVPEDWDYFLEVWQSLE